MITFEVISPDGFSLLVDHASSILNQSQNMIRDIFREDATYLFKKLDKEETESILEIRIEEDKVTLSCLLNKEGICLSSYLFFDESINVEQFIRYMNEIFKHNFIEKHWILETCFSATINIESEIGFKFFNPFKNED